jgi:UDP-N-acetylmuramate--alanine ligase
MDPIHLIGIKGSGMSALAQILHDQGARVQGEDIESFLYTQAPLEARRIPLYPFGSAPLIPTMRAVVSNAFDERHPSVIRCRELGIPVERYHHFLGDWIKSYTSIAITGTHGKTTTTGMMAHVLHAIEPTCSLIGDGTGCGTPGARYAVFESCEYRRHFLAYQPDIAVITNIDFDHPDYFADVDDVRDAFSEMAALTGKQLVACGDCPQVRLLRTDTPALYYGFDADNELRASGLTVRDDGLAFDVHYHDAFVGTFTLPVFGRHNVLNALAVLGVALMLDLDMERVRAQLATFPGVKRRFSVKEWGSNVVIDDYAHHPAAIRATLEAARSKYPERKVVGIFQPHTFSRLEKLLDDFAHSLRDADDVFLCPIFGSARENSGTVTLDDLRTRIPGARLVSDDFVSTMSDYRDSILVFMGAGDIGKYQESLYT